MLFLDALSNLERVKTMKTTQRSSRRRARLALLVGAVLLAALAVAAAILFRVDDPASSNTTDNPKGASGSEPQHELVQGADAEKVKAWMDAYREITQTGFDDDADDLPEEWIRLLEEWASSDPSERLAIHLTLLYIDNERASDPQVHEWLVWIGTKRIQDGKDDDAIASELHTDFIFLRNYSGEELKGHIQEMRDFALGKPHSYGSDPSNPNYDPRDPSLSDKENRIREYFYNRYGSVEHREENGRTPRAVIEILVEGMDDLTAAKYLYGGGKGGYYSSDFAEEVGEPWRREVKYAAEYADRVLATDPTSRDALIIKARSAERLNDAIESARRLLKYHPNDERAVKEGVRITFKSYPEETVEAISRLLPEDGLHSSSLFHRTLGNAYERLDMMYEAADQFQKAYAAGDMYAYGRYKRIERGERGYPSIWEERAAERLTEGPPEPAPPSETPETPPQRQPNAPEPPDTPDTPDAPRPEGSPPAPPPGAEMDMAAAYADFAKAYQSAFEMEYGLSEATPEGYMNALLAMARAFAKAGDAQHAQDAYNAVRKRHSREEVERVFRRFDEQERLKRQPPNEEENDDSGEEE